MKLFKKLLPIISATFLILSVFLISTSGSAKAACLYQYNQNGFVTSATPVFNSICGVPDGIGNEPDFVRIRPNVNGNDEDNINNPVYTIGTLSSTCNDGSKYDVWNYVHNDASQNDNPGVGSGSAVSSGTTMFMSAPTGTTSNQFKFTSTIGSSNAVSVSDSAVLDCGSKQVQLSLVPGSIHIYSLPYGTNWQNLSDSSINKLISLGSTNAGLSSMGSGSMWGCWDYRIVIVYQVKVTTVPQQIVMPTCNLISLENNNGVARIDNIEYTANSATVTGYSILVSSNGTTSTFNIGLNSLPFIYNMSSGNTYNFKVYVVSNLGNVTSSNCQGSLTVQTPPPTPTPPTPTPPTPTPPTQLVNTGPGSVIGLFFGATILGAVIYNFVLRKKLSKNNNS